MLRCVFSTDWANWLCLQGALPSLPLHRMREIGKKNQGVPDAWSCGRLVGQCMWDRASRQAAEFSSLFPLPSSLFPLPSSLFPLFFFSLCASTDPAVGRRVSDFCIGLHAYLLYWDWTLLGISMRGWRWCRMTAESRDKSTGTYSEVFFWPDRMVRVHESEYILSTSYCCSSVW